MLTHHQIRSHGRAADAARRRLRAVPRTAVGYRQRSRPRRRKAFLSEIIARVNDLFDGELTDDDKLVYVNNVIKGKLLESRTLQQQAVSSTKEQFGHSPNLRSELDGAIMDALDAHTTMSRQALNSQRVREGIVDILLNHARLWEALRERAGGGAQQVRGRWAARQQLVPALLCQISSCT